MTRQSTSHHRDHFLGGFWSGIPIVPSSFVPRGQIIQTNGKVYYHRHLSVTGKKRRGHGRARNAPRRWKIKQRYVDYGLLDQIGRAANA